MAEINPTGRNLATMPPLIQKLLPYFISESTPLSLREKLRITPAIFAALLVVGLSSSNFFHGYGLPVLIASMGASAVLLLATPRSPLAGPLLSATIGVTCARLEPVVDKENHLVGMVTQSDLIAALCHSGVSHAVAVK